MAIPEGSITNALVTGSSGFLGRNLCAALERQRQVRLFRYDLDRSLAELQAGLSSADVIFHLAGVNRSVTVDGYEGNAAFTQELCAKLIAAGRKPRVILSSSVQVERDNPYGRSKLAAEDVLQRFCEKTRAAAKIYRLKNLFGKWGRPDYNSVTATFCHRIARGLPIEVSDPTAVVDLTYVDDVVAAFLADLPGEHPPGCEVASPLPSHAVSLGELAQLIKSFRDHRMSLQTPDFSGGFVRALYATYLSYLETDDFAYGLRVRSDARGSLAELLKSNSFGQIFVSRTKPGVTRGNHYHDTKTEKFVVLQGEAIVRFRCIDGSDVYEYRANGTDYRVIDIPPGYTHSITNVGSDELVTLFWASEVFDPERPDTHGVPVTKEPSGALG